jgi:small subunit ribosomal protein S17
MADKRDKEKADITENADEAAPEVEATGGEPVEGAETTAPDTGEAADAPQAESAPEAQAPEAEAPAEEPPAGEPPAGEPPAEEPPAEEPPAAEAPAADAPAEEAEEPEAAEGEAAAPAADAPAGPPVAQVAPKERRRKARSTHSGESRPARSPEERHAERVAERRRKATRRRARRLQERAKAAERRAAAPAPEALAPVHAPVEGKRKVRQGIVVSNKAEKTITVRIDVARRHRRYEKIVRSTSTVHAHDENNDAHEGDVVRVIESRPLSRTKRWALVDVLERAR